MDINRHINISTEGNNYEFDLIAQEGDWSSGYKIVPTNEGLCFKTPQRWPILAKDCSTEP